MSSFYEFDNRFIITATLEMKTPLSVGSRISLLPAGSDLPVMKTPQGLPFIPGSSLKGVVRAYTEQILRTLDALKRRYDGQRLWACDPLDEEKRCVIRRCCDKCEDCQGDCCERCSHCKACMVKRATKDNVFDDELFTKELIEKSCTACRLFGSPWLASRVHFQDAFLTNSQDLPRLTEVRDGVGIDRDLGSAKRRIKFDFETVPAGATFGIRIVVENAEDWEMGLLLLALRAMERGELPIGGKTTRGLGWGELREIKIERVCKENLLEWLEGRPPSVVEPSALIRTFTQGLTQGGEGDA